MSRAWPVTLTGGHDGSVVRLRPLHPRRDRRTFLALRRENADWTRPWDSTSPRPREPAQTFGQMVRAHEREARAGRMLPFALDVDGRLAGQVHLFTIVEGALRGGGVGYWITRRHAGRGLVPYALAMLVDHAFGALELHRVEVNLRDENVQSRRVVEKLGMREEGVRRAYLHIDGGWRDHRSFALTVEDLDGERAVDRLRRGQASRD